MRSKDNTATTLPMKRRTKSRTICDLEASTQEMDSDSVPTPPEHVVLFKKGKVVNKGKSSFAKIDCRRLDQKKMRSCIQASNEDGLTDYEKLRAVNIKRNTMVLSALELPEIDNMQKSKKETEKGKELAGKRNKMKGHQVFLKEKTINITEAAVAAVEEYKAPSGMKDLCWSCKVKLGSPSSLFCEQCGRRQGGPEVGMVPLRCSTQRKSDNKVEPENHKEEVDDAFGIPDTLLTYERVFHPRPRRLPTHKLWGKGFLKKHYQRQHEKLNLNHKDVRHWFSKLDNEFVTDFLKHPSIRHDPHMMKRLTEFVKAREPELVTLLFVDEGISLRWKVDDIVRYAIEIKHY